MAFKTTKAQLIQRDAIAAEVRDRAHALNVAIADFNRQFEPLVRAVAEAQTHYNAAMESARTLASEISNPAREQFDAKSEKEIDPEEHASALESGPGTPAELEHMH
jgi:hypothetical protein